MAAEAAGFCDGCLSGPLRDRTAHGRSVGRSYGCRRREVRPSEEGCAAPGRCWPAGSSPTGTRPGSPEERWGPEDALREGRRRPRTPPGPRRGRGRGLCPWSTRDPRNHRPEEPARPARWPPRGSPAMVPRPRRSGTPGRRKDSRPGRGKGPPGVGSRIVLSAGSSSSSFSSYRGFPPSANAHAGGGYSSDAGADGMRPALSWTVRAPNNCSSRFSPMHLPGWRILPAGSSGPPPSGHSSA